MSTFFGGSSRSSISSFCWKHRGKLAVASLGIGAVLGAAYYYYGDETEENVDSDEDDEEDDSSDEINMVHESDPAAIQKRTNELIAANDLFDFSLTYFLPTIKHKVKEVVDVTDTIKKLKDLMKRDTAPDQHVSKAALWREIKLSAFNSMITTAYAISGASLLLMVQMHLLVRHRARAQSPSSASFQDHSGVFRELMEETFGYFFKFGIVALARANKDVIDGVFKEVDWTVESTLRVRHEDLSAVLRMMKAGVEGDVAGGWARALLRMMFGGAHDQKSSSAAGRTGGKSVSFLPSVEPCSRPSAGAGGGVGSIQGILEETWQVVDSPMFQRAFCDVSAAVLSFLTSALWKDVFLPLHQAECAFPPQQPLPQPQQQGGPSGSTDNSHLELESPHTTPLKERLEQQRQGHEQDMLQQEEKKEEEKEREEESRAAVDHKYRDASLPLAKLLPKIKIVACKLIPEDSSSAQTNDRDYFAGLAPGVAPAKGRPPALQRIRKLCGADDVCSNSFNLCSMLLERRIFEE